MFLFKKSTERKEAEKASYKKIERPEKQKGWLKKLFLWIVLILLIYGFFIGTKALIAVGAISVKNRGSGSPFLKFPKLDPNALKGEGDGRINILLIGVGGKTHKGGMLADTVMVFSVDPQNKEAALLSIPRDLRVPIPKPIGGYDKLNAVHSYGEQQKIKGGGPELLKQAVADILDLPIHYFVRVDFEGFKKIIDSLGGITINVEKAINDPFYPDKQMEGYEPLYIPVGQVKMNGELALKYARSRETTSDFDRAKRQQQIIATAKEKALSANFLANPQKLTQLINIVGEHFRTDLGLGEMERLYSIVKDIPRDKIVSRVLDNSPDGPLQTLSDNGYYLVPKDASWKQVQAIAHAIFTDPFISQEKAAIVLENASGKNGLATTVADELKALGYNVVSIKNASANVKKTAIEKISTKKTPYTVQFLENRFQVKTSDKSQTGSSIDYPYDLKIILGEDYVSQ